VLITFVVKCDADALREGECVGWATEIVTGQNSPFATSAELVGLLRDAATAEKAEEAR
jgi:hypothetical protein